ncbi:MAG: PRC-barrel domain-containing protein [Gemmatimonadetes bacterium]|nr:PRC-barrel domain-containing protein [Gemmatimonadota bacterium]MCC6771885.1 PRC-barrel domain-containing protein [Gemmatimonadaceae bacterium]
MNKGTNNAATDPNSSGAAASTLVAGRDVEEFEVVPPMIDVRGWDVMLADGSKLGTVDRFMLHQADNKLRYLAVTPVGRAGHLLVPVGVGTVDLAARQVLLNDVHAEHVEALPTMGPGVVTREFERQVFGAVTGVEVKELALPAAYDDPMYDASELFGAKVKPVTKS